MRHSFYKANSKITGCGTTFYLSNERDCVFLNMIQQSGWNDQTKKGSFKDNIGNPEKSISVKINVDELGGILAALKTFGEWNAFHTFADNKTQLKFAVWDRSQLKKPNAMSFVVTKNGSLSFKTFFEPGEVEILKILFSECAKEIMWAKSAKQEKDAE